MSIPLEISVLNKFKNSSISIQEYQLGEVQSWVSILNNSIAVDSSKTGVFDLTINVPSTAQDLNYLMYLNFKAVDSDGATHYFSHTVQFIMVDKSNPETPSYSTSINNNSINTYNWHSYDARSNEYTNINTTSGLLGIKDFTATIKYQSGEVKETKTILAINGNSYNFGTLSPNATYLVSLTAKDLAGNTSSITKTLLTAPAPPTLSVSKASFCYISLTWNATAGSTSYKIYDNTTSTATLVTTTSNTSYTINGLPSNKTKKYTIIAINSQGSQSNPSTLLTTSTLDVPKPIITGGATVCSSGATFIATNFPAENTISWTYGPALSLVSSSGNQATFKATGSSSTWIKTKFNAGCGADSTTLNLDAGTPKPGPIGIYFDVPPKRFTAYITPMVSATSYKWYLDGILKYTTTMDEVVFQRVLGDCDRIYYVDVAMVNACGTSGLSHTEVSEPPCYEGYAIYPNPATGEINITTETSNLKSTFELNSNPKSITSVRIIDNNGITVELKHYGNETNSIKINISSLQKGTYLLIVNEENNPESYLFVKE